MNAIDAMPGGGNVYASLTPELGVCPVVLMRFADGEGHCGGGFEADLRTVFYEGKRQSS